MGTIDNFNMGSPPPLADSATQVATVLVLPFLRGLEQIIIIFFGIF